ALAVYDSVLTLDPQYRNAVLARAQVLAWAGRRKESLAAYERWIAAHPADREAPLDYARTLAWDGRLGEAESLYIELARTGNRDATKGLARVIGWRGELERSERMWRRVLVTDPNDAEARTGLAQVLSWQGRQLDAETELQLALRTTPGYGDARSLLRTVQADLRPNATTTLIVANDTDRNRVSTLQVDYAARALWNGNVGARYSERWADFASTDSRASTINLFASWQPRPGAWIVRADAGAARQSFALVSAARRHRTLGSGGIRFAGGLGPLLRVGFGASRLPFDETAVLVANGIVISSFEAEGSLPLPARFSLAGGAAYSRLTGGRLENARRAGSATLRWTASRRWSIAVGARQFGYDTAATDGYFSPRRYTLADASVRGRIGEEMGWNAEGEAGLGRQSVALFGAGSTSRRAERLAASVGYRLSPAREFTAAATYSNVAAPGQTGGSEYSANSVLLRARLRF
ncbi:MAG TPA: hypothetical protein VNJ04_19795, partial [Gemmatimonadaceae bacterium]|nr:hypothetical protein [Gemmatimonadaceae bacterium]